MIKFIFAILIILGSTLSFAQTSILRSTSDQRRITYWPCRDNHKLLLDAYRDQIDSQISRLMVGIDIEESGKAPEIRMKSYYSLLLNLVVRRIVFDEMTKQLMAFDFDLYKTQEGLRKNVFNIDAIKVNLDARSEKILSDALDNYNRKELSDQIVRMIKKKLITNTATAIGGQLLKSFGTGLVANLSGAALKTALVGIGTEALAGAVRGGILSLLTMPLMGNRPPPETVWTDLLEDHPEIIINPEWMRLAKTQDHPWMAHCAAMLRRTDILERVLIKNLKNEEGAFIKSVTSISQIDEIKVEKNTNRRLEIRNEYPKAVVDNTYVKKYTLLPEELVPFWARKR